jgi:hypothetical protein
MPNWEFSRTRLRLGCPHGSFFDCGRQPCFSSRRYAQSIVRCPNESARAEQDRLKDEEDVETRLKAIEGKLDTALAGIKMLMPFAERHLNMTERHVTVTERQLSEPERKH